MIATLLFAWLAAPATAVQQHDSLTPPRRAHHALVYDESRRRVLLTGGSTPVDGGQRFEFFNDLWAFDGTRWSRLPSSGIPMSGIGLAFDGATGRPVSYGGYTGRALSDLRILEDSGWRTVGQNVDMPSAEPGFVYDSRRKRFVAFGGSADPGQAHGVTWELEGTTWRKVGGAGPPARQSQAMAYDAKRGRTVIFGGSGSRAAPGQPPPRLGDTWEFDGTAWTERKVSGPSPRAAAGVAWDSKRGLVILFGGMSSAGFQGDTWSWDGTQWKKLADTGPAPRAMGYMAYDKDRDRVVLFGGRKGWPDGDLNDTWEWDGSAWRRIDTGGP